MEQVQRQARSLLKYAILIALCLVIMGPIVTAVLGSIRTTGELMTTPFGLPRNGIRWENYTTILQSGAFWNSLKNSLIITVGVTLLNILLSSMLAFVFSRIQFRGRGLLFNILMIGLLFPLVVAILPIFIQVRQLGLINSMLGVILPLVAFGLPGSVIILRTFFASIPSELEDAAYIDGCTTFGFFRYILVPLARPAMIAVATLQVIASWNEYFLPLLVFVNPDLWPLPLGIMQFQGQYGTDYARIMAYVTLLIIPAVLFYLVAEKYIVTGLTGGELKG
ncbi:MAG TPA: carbohydrate ABC transporter permease [Oceanobacillus sp.]|nr:carbohydrate ABC transporter permease [Oceanobacillus sp.]